MYLIQCNPVTTTSYYYSLLTTFEGGGTSLLWVADMGHALQIYCSLHNKIPLVKLKAIHSEACIPQRHKFTKFSFPLWYVS
jgi:L-alanine-DL-glutamate epimerase-like enolase superfamily enzyme